LYRDESKAVAGGKSLIFWVVLLLLSAFLILDSEQLGAIEIWSAFALVIGLAAVYYRIRKFTKSSNDLLQRGESSTPYDHRRQFRTLLLVVFLTPIAFFFPLLLASELSFGFWLGSILGILDGWVLGILLYNFYLFNWQKTNKGKLFVLQKWDGSRVTHLGMTFVRYGEND
jgi:positive regulator of sigma E activity